MILGIMKHMHHLNNVGYNGIMMNGNINQFLLIFTTSKYQNFTNKHILSFLKPIIL